jgi:eukaryotic-like serine/threonine-protein kinase
MTIASRDLAALDRLLDTALSLQPEARARWVEMLSGEDASLKAVLRDLLMREDLSETGDFLATLPKLVEGPVAPHAAATPGDMVGPYRLERIIGSGGMGSVWLAARADGLLQRKVALKLPHVAAPAAGLAERMARERNILAVLEHPSIARLYDAGVTADGLPYLALEYVEGEPIDAYCRNHGLGIGARLQLIVQVARAVAYAHTRLVVHRDLKPSNIVVDAAGGVHLLDFGIAAILSDTATGQALADTSLTRQIGSAWTPDYASPEQIRSEPVSTASDVYSLGVVLFEILAGCRPFNIKRGDVFGTAQTILTVDPRAPSQACRDPAMRRKLRGDLDTIVLKALRKEPTQRYATVAELADDLERQLEGRPVLARPDSLTYRLAKFVRRHRVGVLAAGVIALSLFAGLVGTLTQARRAIAQERVAQEAKARAERRFTEVRQLAHSILFDYHDAIKDLPGATPVRARLAQDALKYLDRLAQESRGDTDLQRELAEAYQRVGNIQGGTMFANLGDTKAALKSQRKALALRRQIATADPHDVRAARDLAVSLRTVGILQWETGDMDAALAQVRGALQVLLPIAGQPDAAPDLRVELAGTYNYAGRIMQERGDTAGAREQYAADIAILEALLRTDPSNPSYLRALSVALEQTGAAFMFEGDLPHALASHREALKLRQQLTATAPFNADYQRTVGVSWYNIGEVLAAQGKVRDALDSYQHQVDIASRLLGADHKNQEYRGDLAYSEVRVGDMLAQLHRTRGALASYRRSLPLREEDVHEDPSNLWKRSSLIEIHAKLSGVLATSDPAAALVEAGKALSLMRSTQLDPQNAEIRSFFAQTYADLADIHMQLAAKEQAASAGARLRAARELYRRGEEIWKSLDERAALSNEDRSRRERARQSAARLAGVS